MVGTFIYLIKLKVYFGANGFLFEVCQETVAHGKIEFNDLRFITIQIHDRKIVHLTNLLVSVLDFEFYYYNNMLH